MAAPPLTTSSVDWVFAAVSRSCVVFFSLVKSRAILRAAVAQPGRCRDRGSRVATVTSRAWLPSQAFGETHAGRRSRAILFLGGLGNISVGPFASLPFGTSRISLALLVARKHLS